MSTEILVPRSARPVPWLARMRQQFRSFTRPPKNLSEITIADRYFSGGDATTAGVYVSVEAAFTFSAVFDAVNQISSDIGKLPCNLRKRRSDGGSDLYEASKLYRLIKYEPNPEMGSMVFRRTLTAHALTWGDGFAEIERDALTDRPKWLWPLTPDRVQPFREQLPGGRLGPLQYRIDGRTILEARDVLHIHGLGRDGYTGYSIIDKARQAIGLALAGEKFLGSFFGNGTRFGGVLSSDQDLDEDQKEEIRKSINDLHSRADKAFRLLILGAGFKFTESGKSPRDTDMASIRDQQIEEVARFYRLPPHRLGLNKPGTVSYASVEMSNLDYYTGALLDWISIWEEEMNRKLISSLENRQQFIKHNANAFLRGDIKSRYEALGIARDKGIINADEWRELEDMNPQEGGQGKLYLVQSAQVPLNKLADLADAQIEATKAPKTPPPAPNAPTDGAAAGDETKALRERLDLAEAFAAQARAEATLERDQRIAAEASGSATAAEVERLRQAESAAATRALTAEVLLQERLSDLTDAWATRDAFRDELAGAEQRVTDAETKAMEADARAIEAERVVASAKQAAEDAAELARVAKSLAEEAQRSAETARASDVASAEQRDASDAEAAEMTKFAAAAALEQQAAEERAAEAAAVAAAAGAEVERLRAEIVTAAADLETERSAAAAREEASRQAHAADMEQVTRLNVELLAQREHLNGDLAEETERRKAAEGAHAAASAAIVDAERLRAHDLAEARAAAETFAGEMAKALDDTRAAADAATTEAKADAAALAERLEAETQERVAAERRHAEAEQRQAEMLVAAVAAETMARELRDAKAAADAATEAVRAQAEALEARLAAETGQRVEGERQAIQAAEAAAGALAETEARLQAATAAALADGQRAHAEFVALSEKLEAEREVRARAETEWRQIQTAEDGGLAATVAAHRTLVVDIMRRMVERETDRARRAQATPEKIRRWIETFYEGHEDLLRTALLPAVRIHLAFLRSEDDPVEASRRLAQAHVTESQRQLLTVLDGDADEIAASLTALLHRWDQERPTVIADRLMQKEIEYARSR